MLLPKTSALSVSSPARGWWLLPFGLLAACSPDPQASNVSQATDLETAAIERGLVRDPADSSIVGLYARDTDRVCVVPDGGGYRAGAYVDYGDGISCSGAGPLTRAGDRLRLTLGEDCAVDATFDGDRITFPGRMPDGCKALCSGRASLAALDVRRLSESIAEASAMRDARGRLPCRTS